MPGGQPAATSILLGMSSTHGNGPALDPKIYCDGLKDFAPMTHVAIRPIVLAMRWARHHGSRGAGPVETEHGPARLSAKCGKARFHREAGYGR